MSPAQKRQTAASVPAAEPVELPEKWRCAPDELTAVEMDAAMRAVGIKADDMESHPMSLNAAYAVVLARRTNPRIPVSTWRQIRVAELEFEQPADLEDPADPTEPA